MQGFRRRRTLTGMAHSLFAYGFLGKAVKQEVFLGKSGEGATADFPPLPPTLAEARSSGCQSRARTFPPHRCSRKMLFQALELKFLISFLLPTSDFFPPTSFVQVWISMGYKRQTHCPSHSYGTLHPVDKL